MEQDKKRGFSFLVKRVRDLQGVLGGGTGVPEPSSGAFQSREAGQKDKMNGSQTAGNKLLSQRRRYFQTLLQLCATGVLARGGEVHRVAPREAECLQIPIFTEVSVNF